MIPDDTIIAVSTASGISRRAGAAACGAEPAPAKGSGFGQPRDS